MGALDTLVNLAVDQNRRSNISGIMDGLQDGSIQPNQALIKLSDVTGDPGDLINGIKQRTINIAQGLNADGTPMVKDPDADPSLPWSSGFQGSNLQSLPQFETNLGQNTANPQTYQQGRIGEVVANTLNNIPAGTNPMQALTMGDMAAAGASGNREYLKDIMETVMNAQKAQSEIGKNNAQAQEAKIAGQKGLFEMGGNPGGGGGAPSQPIGLPSVPDGTIPAIDPSQLNEGTPPDAPPNPGIGAVAPSGAAGGSLGQAPNAGLGGQAALEVAKKQATENAVNAAAVQKNVSLMLNNLPVMQNQFQKMRDANQQSSLGPLNDEEGNGLLTTYHGLQNDPTSVANGALKKLSAQNVIREIGPQLQQGGVKGNKFLENVISDSSGVDLTSGKNDRANQIDLLQNNYVQGLQSSINQLKGYGIDPTPIIHQALPTPQLVASAVKSGAISEDDAKKIAATYHGISIK